jgi:hypothetical protein
MTARLLNICIVFGLMVGLGACAAGGWKQLQDEFPEVRANCGLRGTVLERDGDDRRLLRLVFRQRYNARLQASRDGSLACVEHWARERGWRVTTAPGGEGG